ncbi:hypothetical protein Tco_0877598 [Tanacetum coccineum]|uniref:Uncharacterized protein n=1 Tax=Tanacetum coccineum TaxID=301880 RepID=A0ABQ5BY24_9ASTR
MTQQSEIVELRAADQRRQTVISELLKADYRRQRQLAETLKIVKSLKAQMIEMQRQQGPAMDPAEPELPEEAGQIDEGVTAVIAQRAATQMATDSHTQELELEVQSSYEVPEEADKIEKICRLDARTSIYFTQGLWQQSPKTMQEAIEMATGLMKGGLNTLELMRQTENIEEVGRHPRNNQNQHQNKRQKTGKRTAADCSGW